MEGEEDTAREQEIAVPVVTVPIFENAALSLVKAIWKSIYAADQYTLCFKEALIVGTWICETGKKLGHTGFSQRLNSLP